MSKKDDDLRGDEMVRETVFVPRGWTVAFYEHLVIVAHSEHPAKVMPIALASSTPFDDWDVYQPQKGPSK